MKTLYLNFVDNTELVSEPAHLNFIFGIDQIKQLLAQKAQDAYQKVVAVHGAPKDCDDAKYHYRVCAEDRARIFNSTNIDDKAYVQAYDRFLPEAQARIDKMCYVPPPAPVITPPPPAPTTTVTLPSPIGAGTAEVVTPAPIGAGTADPAAGAEPVSSNLTDATGSDKPDSGKTEQAPAAAAGTKAPASKKTWLWIALAVGAGGVLYFVFKKS